MIALCNRDSWPFSRSHDVEELATRCGACAVTARAHSSAPPPVQVSRLVVRDAGTAADRACRQFGRRRCDERLCAGLARAAAHERRGGVSGGSDGRRHAPRRCERWCEQLERACGREFARRAPLQLGARAPTACARPQRVDPARRSRQPHLHMPLALVDVSRAAAARQEDNSPSHNAPRI